MKKITWLLFLLILGCGKDDAVEKFNITWEVNGQGISNRIQGGGYGNEYQVTLPWSSTYKTEELNNLGLFVRLNDSTLENDGLERITLKIDGVLIVEKTKWLHSASVTPGTELPDDTGLWSYIDGSEGRSYSALPPPSFYSD